MIKKLMVGAVAGLLLIGASNVMAGLDAGLFIATGKLFSVDCNHLIEFGFLK